MIVCEEPPEMVTGVLGAELAPGGRKGSSSGTEEEDSGKPWHEQIWKRVWEVEGILHVFIYHTESNTWYVQDMMINSRSSEGHVCTLTGRRVVQDERVETRQIEEDLAGCGRTEGMKEFQAEGIKCNI